MASAPKEPPYQFLVLPIIDGVIQFNSMMGAASPKEADENARLMVKGESEPSVVIFQAIKMIAQVKTVDTVWQPRTGS